MYFDAILVVPFDDSVNLFSILKQDHHRRLAVHLADEVVILRVCLLWWSRLFPVRLGIELFLNFIQVWPDQFSIQDCLFPPPITVTRRDSSLWKATGKRDMKISTLIGSCFKERVTHLFDENNVFFSVSRVFFSSRVDLKGCVC